MIGLARPGIVRSRLRKWERLANYLAARRAGAPWPRSEVEMVDYLHMRVAAGAPMSFPRDFHAAVYWMERRAGFPAEENYGNTDALRNTVEWATA